MRAGAQKLAPYIRNYWILKGNALVSISERTLPVGCVYPIRHFCFKIDSGYLNMEEMLNELFENSETVNFTGYLGYKLEGGTPELAGGVSLGASRPMMHEVEGEIVTVWDSMTIAQTDM